MSKLKKRKKSLKSYKNSQGNHFITCTSESALRTPKICSSSNNFTASTSKGLLLCQASDNLHMGMVRKLGNTRKTQITITNHGSERNLGKRCLRTQRAPKVKGSSFNLHFWQQSFQINVNIHLSNQTHPPSNSLSLFFAKTIKPG